MFQVHSSTYGQIDLIAFDPIQFGGRLLSGSTMLTNDHAEEKIVIQEFNSNLYTIRHSEFFFHTDTVISIQREKKNFRISICLKNKYHEKSEAFSKTIKEGQFILIPFPIITEEYSFNAKKNIIQFSLDYSFEIIQPLIPYFPQLEKIMDTGEHKKNFLPAVTKYMPGQAIEIIQNIMNCYYEPVLRNFFFEDQVKDLLFYLLVHSHKPPPAIKNLSPGDIDKIHAAASLIENVSQHLTITTLSRKVHLNEFKLKSGFRQIYGVGPFTFFKNLRMKKARELLLSTNKPLKEIASLAGYSSITAFVGAFKKYFGTTAGSLRK